MAGWRINDRSDDSRKSKFGADIFRAGRWCLTQFPNKQATINGFQAAKPVNDS